jgi:SAM-dependent methyltransferase
VNSAVPPTRYPFDNAAPQAGDRFATLATLYDGTTRRHLDRLGIGPGWTCLDVGAGGGSIARFMSERVGPAGHVVATDINIDWMVGSLPANVELRRHDIGVDALPERAFDIVHARAVLTFVPERQSAVKRMVAAVKPGGWLLVEELVPPVTEALDPPDEPDIEIARNARLAVVEIIRRSGGDPFFARKLPALVTDAGLTDFGAEGYFVPFRNGAVAGLAKANIDQLGSAIEEAGLMSAADLDRYRSILERPDCHFPASMALISVWGRRQLP